MVRSARYTLQFFQANLNRLQSHNRKHTVAVIAQYLLFGQLILELLRAHRLALVVQKLAVKRRPPLDTIELAGAACLIESLSRARVTGALMRDKRQPSLR
jgi:hypothetical protein